MSEQLDVEVSVVTMGNEELLSACLRTVGDACRGLDWRLTVIDNSLLRRGSRAFHAAVPNGTVVENHEPLGFGANHNKVLARVLADRSARYVLVLNDDTELEPEAITKLVAFCDEHERIGLATPRLVYTDGSHQPAGFRFPTLKSEAFAVAIFPEWMHARLWPRLVEVVPTDDRPTEVDWVLGAAMLVRVSALDGIGAFDERFFLYSEELDLARRLADEGFSSAIVPTATVRHAGGQSIRTSFRRAAGRSRWLYLEKHWGRARLAVLALVLAVVYLWNAMYVLMRIALAPATLRPKLDLWLAHWRRRPLP